MAGNPLHKPVIPRRSRSCSKTKKKFEPGSEYISIISEGEKEGHFDREDIYFDYWKEHEDKDLIKRSRSYWRANVPLGPDVPKEPEELLERAFELFFEYSEKESPEDQLRAFILALFLARKKVFIFRQEIMHNNCPAYLYEITDTEEVICLPVLKPTPEQIQEIQDELSREVGIVPTMS
ncbi:MAG: hypothetical protein K940chlam3_00739 [Chlamydiae bacterium]|nr:hypothetical protein [Chlamydiota bacterium]